MLLCKPAAAPCCELLTCMRQACYGHTEGAAGLTGALAVLAILGSREAPAVLCLRHVNPHVGAALGGWAAAAGSAPLLPRQGAPSVTAQPTVECLAGMSQICFIGCAGGGSEGMICTHS